MNNNNNDTRERKATVADVVVLIPVVASFCDDVVCEGRRYTNHFFGWVLLTYR